MTGRVVLLDPQRPLAFLENACATLAEVLEDTPPLSPTRDAVALVYAEVVGAYARLVREELSRVPEMSPVWFHVVDHLLERMRQVRAQEIAIDAAEIASQLHARVREATAPL